MDTLTHPHVCADLLGPGETACVLPCGSACCARTSPPVKPDGLRRSLVTRLDHIIIHKAAKPGKATHLDKLVNVTEQ